VNEFQSLEKIQLKQNLYVLNDKNVASYEDFKASTINTNINIDFGTPTQNCLGRYSEKIDCDWAAYGLFGTLGDGINILSEDSSFEVFDFADIEVAE